VLLSSAGLLLGLTRSYSRLLWNTLEQEPPGSPLPRRECWVPAALVAGLLALSVAAAPVQRYLQAAAAQLVATSHAGAVGATAGRPP
jgi:hypothetical protein